MTFTKEPPTKPGWFLWKLFESETVPILCLVTEGDDGRLWRDGKAPATNGEWCRLVPAEELQLAWEEDRGGKFSRNGQWLHSGRWNESRAKRVMDGRE